MDGNRADGYRPDENRMDGGKTDGTGCSDDMGSNIYNRQDFPIGMAYVPWSKFMNLYEPERGLNVGTIFMDLDKPFLGRRAFRK